MKKISIILVVSFSILTACSNMEAQKKAEDNTKIDTAIKKDSKVKTIHLTKEDFLKKVDNYEKNPTEWKYLGDKPCLIDFYATWCGPCKTIAPILEELAAEYSNEIYIYKVDVDAEEDLAKAFNISSIPTIIFVPMTGAPQIAQGALPKETFKQAINEILLGK